MFVKRCWKIHFPKTEDLTEGQCKFCNIVQKLKFAVHILINIKLFISITTPVAHNFLTVLVVRIKNDVIIYYKL